MTGALVLAKHSENDFSNALSSSGFICLSKGLSNDDGAAWLGWGVDQGRRRAGAVRMKRRRRAEIAGAESV
jgi:S-formylglutathione hydrolase FrmB